MSITFRNKEWCKWDTISIVLQFGGQTGSVLSDNLENIHLIILRQHTQLKLFPLVAAENLGQEIFRTYGIIELMKNQTHKNLNMEEKYLVK